MTRSADQPVLSVVTTRDRYDEAVEVAEGLRNRTGRAYARESYGVMETRQWNMCHPLLIARTADRFVIFKQTAR